MLQKVVKGGGGEALIVNQRLQQNCENWQKVLKIGERLKGGDDEKWYRVAKVYKSYENLMKNCNGMKSGEK